MKIFIGVIFCLISTLTFSQKIAINFKIENEKSIVDYLDEKKLVYNLEDIAILKDIKVFSDYGNTERLVVPEAYFFNKEGFLLKNKNKGVGCGASIKNITKIIKSKFDTNQQIKNWLKDYQILGTTDVSSDEYDICVLINWAIFLDSNNETSFKWYTSLKNNKELKIKVILINLDVQEIWNLTDGQKEFLGV